MFRVSQVNEILFASKLGSELWLGQQVERRRNGIVGLGESLHLQCALMRAGTKVSCCRGTESGRLTACCSKCGDGSREKELDSSTRTVWEGERILDLPTMDGRELSKHDQSNDLMATISPHSQTSLVLD